MIDFKNAIERLEKFSAAINKAIVVTAVMEAIFVIIISVAASNVNTSDEKVNKIATWALILFGLFYLFLLFIKTMYNISYPGSITNELKSERELTNLQKDSERQKIINGFLVTTIERLNGQTCALNYGDDTRLCDKGIKDGIYSLMEPVIDNVFFVLDTINTKFTIGVYLKNYRSMASIEQWESGIIVVDDKLGKGPLLIKDLLLQENVKEEKFSLQVAIRQSFNNYEFIKSDYYVGQDKFTIICSPMPFACNEIEVNGVLFIISQCLEKVPLETENNLKIFNRVIANWVYRYNECINNRQERILNQAAVSQQQKKKEY